ncbi:flavodoxin [Streptomyces sp. NPDC005485]|uniref:flavodoxin n=1 Tax=Streptomyces sp. NPDC005485 TaxID=3155591 RepID=UPI0033B03284
MVYSSRPGENYFYGDRKDLEIGNTEVVARMIADALPVDVYRIEAADPYPDSYDATVARNVREQQRDARPDIATPLPQTSGYNTLILAGPIWNVRPPMIMRTFLDGVDLAGKTILPLATYAVSGLGATVEEYTTACPRSTVAEGLAVRGEEAAEARGDLTDWLRESGLSA